MYAKHHVPRAIYPKFDNVFSRKINLDFICFVYSLLLIWRKLWWFADFYADSSIRWGAEKTVVQCVNIVLNVWGGGGGIDTCNMSSLTIRELA